MRLLTTLAILGVALFAVPSLEAAPSGFTIEVEGIMTHKQYVDGVLVCEDTGPFRASTGDNPAFAVDGRRSGSVIGVTTECGALAYGFDHCNNGDIIPQHCFIGGAPLTGFLEVGGEGVESPYMGVVSWRSLPDGTYDHVEGYGVWGV